MIVCSCTVVTDRHIEEALIEILNRPDAPIPTPGVVFRHLAKKMNCCGCAPLVVSKIYEIMLVLERDGRICPYRTKSAKVHIERLCQPSRSVPASAETFRARAVPETEHATTA